MAFIFQFISFECWKFASISMSMIGMAEISILNNVLYRVYQLRIKSK